MKQLQENKNITLFDFINDFKEFKSNLNLDLFHIRQRINALEKIVAGFIESDDIFENKEDKNV